MKHLKMDTQRKPMSKVKIIVICVIVGVLAFAGTLFGLMWAQQNAGYREALNYTNEIAKTKDAVSEYLVAENEGLEVSDENQKKVEDFENAVDKAAQYMESLSASSALKNKEIAEKYNTAKTEFEKLQNVKEIEKTVMSLVDLENGISDEKLEELKNGANKYLADFAKDLADYKKEAKEFAEKYQDAKTINEDEMIEDYGNFQIKGEALLDKYSEVSFDDIYGFSKEDVMNFYTRIDEIATLLNEKI